MYVLNSYVWCECCLIGGHWHRACKEIMMLRYPKNRVNKLHKCSVLHSLLFISKLLVHKRAQTLKHNNNLDVYLAVSTKITRYHKITIKVNCTTKALVKSFWWTIHAQVKQVSGFAIKTITRKAAKAVHILD